MDYIAVPGEVGSSTARIWVGSLVDGAANPTDTWFEHPPSGARWMLGAWDRWQGPDAATFLRYQRVPLTGLQPATRYPLQLRVAGQVRAQAEITTLPTILPSMDEPPFIVMLGSCFSRLQDSNGQVGRTLTQLPAAAKPSVKFLVGDQVYLDSPWYRFTLPRSQAALARGFFSQYVETWRQGGDVQGFNHLLRAGATYFCSDDHEFWNNAPFPSSFAVNTWTDSGRRAWWTTARALYQAFQTTGSRASFRVGLLEFLLLDTRVNRDGNRQAFLSPDDFAAFETWVDGLTGPGVLVLGQPVFAGPAGVAGHIADWNLPDFAQYRELCRVLLNSRQSIVVLTGDVHYGRIASATLRSGAELVEIIASPMALVDRSAGGKWHAAPGRFPSVALEGLASVPVQTNAGWTRFANHFITLEFNQTGGGVRLRVRAWETEPSDTTSGSAVLADLTLKRT
jgi:hypothetical protein